MRQNRALASAGSFQNNLMGNNDTLPVVGQPATRLMYTDRYVYEVIAVSEEGKRCRIRRMRCRRVGDLGLSESQQYEYISAPELAEMELVWRPYRERCQHTGTSTGEWREERTYVDFTAAMYRAAEAAGRWVEDVLTAEQRAAIYPYGRDAGMFPVPGITKVRKKYSSCSIIFGVADEYFDPSF